MENNFTVTCKVCESNSTKKYKKYLNKSIIFKDLYLYKCETCTSYFSIFKGSSDLLKQYYTNSNISSIGKSKSKMSEYFGLSLAKIRSDYIINILKKNNTIKILNILEVGPGAGHLFKSLDKKINFFNYDALEDDLSIHAKISNLNINILDIENLKNNYYNLIILSHVYEHVKNPYKYLKMLKNKLKENGFIFIDVPCEDWRYKKFYDPHLTFFNKKSFLTLSNLLKFKLISLDYIGHDISVLNLYFENKIFNRLRILLNLSVSFIEYLGNFTKTNFFMIFYKNYYKFSFVNKNKARWIRCILQK